MLHDWAQNAGQKLREHPIWGRRVGRALALPASHVGQNLATQAGQLEDDLDQIWGSGAFRDR